MRDPGLQPERTALAWQRTALSMLVNGGLLLRSAMLAQSTWLVVVAVAILAAALSTFGLSTWRHRVLLRAAGPRSPHAALMLLLGATVIVSAGAGLLGAHWGRDGG